MSINTKEELLKEAIITAALHAPYWEAATTSLDTLGEAVFALADYRAGVASLSSIKNGTHWIKNIDEGATWSEGWGQIQTWDFADGYWHDMYGDKSTPVEMYDNDWRYLEPAIYTKQN